MKFEDIKKVIVLCGGPSAEAAVSRVTAKGMADALRALGLSHEVKDISDEGWFAWLVHQPREGLFVLIALHGCPGEDGTVQGVLDLLGVPYQGSGVLGCAVAMDKVRARMVMAACGLDVAEALWGDDVRDVAKVGALLARHGKLVAKPNASGSSVGVSLVSDMADWPAAYALAAKEGEILVEAFIPGRELTVGVLGDKALAVVEIVANKGAFYDIASKYEVGGSDHICPAVLPDVVTTRAQQGAIKAARAVAARGACRVDFRYDETSGRLVVLEVNTLPGMTPTSLLPDAARYATMSYPALVRWMIDDSLTRLNAR